MKKWIEFNINHPKIVMLILGLVTILAGYGFKNIHFDSSTEALMPKDSIEYKLGERVKEIFIDSKSYLLVAIEPEKGEDLFSYKTFNHLNNLVSELEEFKSFNFKQENLRLESLIKVGSISYRDKQDTGIKKSSQNTKVRKNNSDIEAELDMELINGRSKSEQNINKKPENNSDLWDLNKPVTKHFYAKPVRNRREYNYEKYLPVKSSTLTEKLDKQGIEQFKSILRYINLDPIGPEQELTRDEFRKILEAWETVYLYKSMKIIKSLNNPISGEDIQGTEAEIKPVKLIEKDESGNRLLPKSDKDFTAYRSKLLKNPFFKSLYYSADSNENIRAFAVSMVLRPIWDTNEIFEYFYEVIEKYNTDPVVLTQAGNPVIEKFVQEFMRKDLLILILLVILLVMVTLYFNFRSFSGVLLPMLSILLGTFWTMGLIGLFNIPITLIVNALPPLLVSVGSSYSIHIYNQYLLDRQLIDKYGKKRGLSISMNHVSITVLLAGFTTFIGFITLTVNNVISLRDFGIFSSVGILFAMIISVMLIPSALALMKILPAKERREKKTIQTKLFDKLIGACSSISINKAKPVVIISFIITIFFSFGIFKLKLETSPSNTFKEDSYINISEKKLSNLFEGSFVMSLIIDSGKTDGVKDPQFLNIIEDMRTWIESSENRNKYGFLNTHSFGDIIKRMNMAMNSDKREYYKIPETEADIRDYLEIYSGEDSDSDGRIDNFEEYVDPNFRYVNILIKTGSYGDVPFSSSISTKGQDRLRYYISSHPQANKYNWQLLGEPVNFSVLSALLAQGQISNVLLSILVVGIVILFLFKNISAGIISLIPISISAVVVYGTMGYLGIPLDIPKTLLTSIAIGIGVDDTIHMLKNIRYNLLNGFSVRESIAAAHREGGIAIIYNSIAVGLGFSVFMLSSFKPFFYLGWLVVFIMITMTIGSLIIMPAAIIAFNLQLKKESSRRIFRIFNLDMLFNTENKKLGASAE